jgi:SAM-dependent methyltransferase
MHDAASRRSETIDRHINWIHDQLLSGQPTKILDLGCGPGLYTSRLAKLDHACMGIDFSPASIAYATAQAKRERLQCTYRQQDIRVADYGTGYGLAMIIFGEVNVFKSTDAGSILKKAYRALEPNGLLLLEAHTFSAVRRMGKKPAAWYSVETGLFSSNPHLGLNESFWDTEHNVAIERYYIIDALTGEVTRHSSSTQAYRNEEYQQLLVKCGFDQVDFYPSLSGDIDDKQRDHLVIVAHK